MNDNADVRLIGEVACITTTEFKKRLGLSITSFDLVSIGINPVVESSNAIFWRERDVFIAAMCLAKNLMHVAILNSRKG